MVIVLAIIGAMVNLPRIAGAAILRHRADRPRPADHDRLHPRDGYLRPDHRQRPRHFRDGRGPSGRGVAHAVVDGRDRQHHQGADQGPRDRDCGARGGLAVPLVHRRGPSRRDRRSDQHADRLRRSADRRRGAVPVQLLRDQGGRPRGLSGRVRSAPPVPRASGHHGGHRAARLRPLRRYRHRFGAKGIARARRFWRSSRRCWSASVSERARSADFSAAPS